MERKAGNRTAVNTGQAIISSLKITLNWNVVSLG